jgi:centrosomal protein CEP104
MIKFFIKTSRYVELSSNERTEFKARELKSVHVDAEGLFLKLVLHKNHVNRSNLYNQVGIVAINVIGTDKDSMLLEQPEAKTSVNYDADPSVVAAVNRPDYISPLDDLAFAMYQDPEISQIIRALDKKKTEFVIGISYFFYLFEKFILFHSLF